MAVETEIKLAVKDVERARLDIAKLGYGIHHERTHETNALFDTDKAELRQTGRLIRVRRYGPKSIVTFKGVAANGRHKQREEIEFTVSDGEAVTRVLEELGLHTMFRYEKFRTEYKKDGAAGLITLDETPIGDFIELEGEPEWIDEVALKLGYRESDYIKRSYGALYTQHCERTGTAPADMLFAAKGTGQDPD